MTGADSTTAAASAHEDPGEKHTDLMALAKTCLLMGLCVALAETKFYRLSHHPQQGNPTSRHE